MYKTHNCGELRASDAGKTVTLAGWVHRYRNHGGVYFVDLRDRYGLTQIVIDPSDEKMAEICQSIRFEWVLQVTGVVQLRAGTPNPNLPTGEIEVPAQTIKVLNTCKVLPFSINNPDEKVDEQLRLKYRFLDLRREKMRDNLILRHKLIKFMRDYLDDRGFLEIETPILFKTTPEGTYKS